MNTGLRPTSGRIETARARRFLILCLLVVCGYAMAPLLSSEEERAPSKAAGRLADPGEIDRSVRPGDDFFRYANGRWLDRVRIPDDKASYRLKDMMADRNEEAISRLLEKVIGADSAPKGSAAQKIRDLYLTGLNAEAAEAEGLEPLRAELERIDGLESVKDLPALLARLHALHLTPLFGAFTTPDMKEGDRYRLRLRQGGLGLPGRPYYLSEKVRAGEIREKYTAYLTRLFQLLGEPEESAAKAAEATLAIEIRLAKASLSRTERRDVSALYNRMSVEKLERIAPCFGWGRYFATLTAAENFGGAIGETVGDTVDEAIADAVREAVGDVIVESPHYFEELSRLLEETPPAAIRAYLRANLLNGFAEYMADPFADASFRFHAAELSGKKTRKSRKEMVTETVSQGLGELVGRLYVEEYFPPAAKARMLEITANLKRAFASRIASLTWMSPATKRAALDKLAAMRFRIGYPETWKDYSGLRIEPDSYLKNLKRIARFLHARNLARLGRPVARDEWILDPQTPNAGYAPQRNEVIFPAGFLQPPLFEMDADDAVLYGSIGYGIAHEMTHGFDDQGRKFDKEGNLRDWWTEEDGAEFGRRAQLLVDQYNGLATPEGVGPDGTLTLGENIADLGGLTIAWTAYTGILDGRVPARVDGLTHAQRFFLAYAQFFRGKIREEALRRMVVEDKHPWNAFRVNGAPFNMPAFYEAFTIDPGDRLYREPDRRAAIW